LVFEKIDAVSIKRYSKVRLKTAGNVVELFYSNRWGNGQCPIKKLSKDEYLDTRTGEVKEFSKIENRSESKASLRETFKKVRDLINANTADVGRIRFVTFTYKENMTDTKRLMRDLEKMRKRVKYQIGTFEYISVIEPQGRGAWHSHEIWIFGDKAPFVDQKWLESEMWGFGSVRVKKLDDCDNIGAYLTAYLGDVPLDECTDTDGNLHPCVLENELKIVEVEENNQKVSKHIVKGGRLWMYPPKMNLYRASRGVKRAEVEYMAYEQAEKKIGAATPTFEKNFELVDDNFVRQFSYRYYNTKRTGQSSTILNKEQS